MKNIFYSALIVIISIAFYSCSGFGKKNTADSSTQNTSTKKTIDTADARLANDLSVFCNFQVKAGNLATTKASTQKVKAFGKQNAELYNRLSNNLNSLAEEYDIKLPAAATTVSTENMQKLTGIKEAFDHDYLLQILKQHNITIREINAAKNIQCLPLKQFVISNQADIIKQAYAISDLKDKITR